MTESSRRRVPVISVGNLAMGGRGKTPTTALIARLLLEFGEQPAILSRGYGRRHAEDGVVVVGDGSRQLADVGRGGDEPVMLARQVPGASVFVSDVRATAAALAEEAFGATVHVLDDGFQHRSMRRDIDLVIVTPGDLEGRRMPFGRLRSPVTALRRASGVIVDEARAADVEATLADLIDPQRTAVFTLTRRLGPLRWIERASAGVAPREPERGAPVLAVAGIARPRRFTDALTAAGWRVTETMAFGDHHRFTVRDFARIRSAFARVSAEGVITTEKDAMRLLPFRPLGLPWAFAPLEVAVEPADRFRQWLKDKVSEVRSCAR